MTSDCRTTAECCQVEVCDLALCEADRLVLVPGRLYRFYVADDCPDCEARRDNT